MAWGVAMCYCLEKGSVGQQKQAVSGLQSLPNRLPARVWSIKFWSLLGFFFLTSQNSLLL